MCLLHLTASAQDKEGEGAHGYSMCMHACIYTVQVAIYEGPRPVEESQHYPCRKTVEDVIRVISNRRNSRREQREHG